MRPQPQIEKPLFRVRYDERPMGVRSLGGVVFHTVSHNQFDTYVISSGAIHE